MHLSVTERECLKRELTAHGFKNIRLFGSQARGDASEKSDIDILANPPEKLGLLQLSAIEIELKTLLHKRVQIVLERSLHPCIAGAIHKESLPL